VLLYAWQYYDVVKRFADPGSANTKVWLTRQALTWLFILVFISSGVFDAFCANAKTFYIFKDFHKANTYSNWQYALKKIYFSALILASCISSLFLVCTVMILRKQTLENENLEQMEINRPLTLIHAVLLLLDAGMSFMVGAANQVNKQMTTKKYYQRSDLHILYGQFLNLCLCCMITNIIRQNWKEEKKEEKKEKNLPLIDSSSDSDGQDFADLTEEESD
jgi:hypothetical protein